MPQIINKINIFPIMIPTDMYIDKYGNTNNYIETNPSIFIDNNGSYTILVRTINYSKYKNRAFTIYERNSNSVYYVLRGQIYNNNFNLDNYTIEKVNVIFDIPRQPSLWYGLEDIRFINSNTLLACIPECNFSSPCIFQCTLNKNNITSINKCSPNKLEKNWMPYTYYGIDKVIYSVSPFYIKSVLGDDIEEIELEYTMKNKLTGWHGSTNGINISEGILFLIHKNENEKVIHRWLIFNPDTKTVNISKKFTFFKDSYIEFTCSLSYYNNIFVSIGVNDCKAFIIELNIKDIMKLFNISTFN